MATRMTVRPKARLARPGYSRAFKQTAWGWVGAVGTERGLARLTLPGPEPGPLLEELAREYGAIPDDPDRWAGVFAELERYFAGERVSFDLPLAPEGTEFQLAVWVALRGIPYGETRSYLDVARAVGRPRGPRAVGQAVGSNPLGIVVPCHRVVASGNRIGGFGGALDLKRKLLRLEGTLRDDWTVVSGRQSLASTRTTD